MICTTSYVYCLDPLQITLLNDVWYAPPVFVPDIKKHILDIEFHLLVSNNQHRIYKIVRLFHGCFTATLWCLTRDTYLSFRSWLFLQTFLQTFLSLGSILAMALFRGPIHIPSVRLFTHMSLFQHQRVCLNEAIVFVLPALTFHSYWWFGFEMING